MENSILSFSAPYGVQHELLKETGFGIAVMYDDRESAKKYIFSLYSRWQAGESIHKDMMGKLDHKDMTGKLDQCSREYQTRQLVEIIDNL